MKMAKFKNSEIVNSIKKYIKPFQRTIEDEGQEKRKPDFNTLRNKIKYIFGIFPRILEKWL